MTIRTILLRGAVPLALLACSASTGSEAPDEESAAVLRGPSASTSSEAPDGHSADLVIRGPSPIRLCGLAGERACSGSTPCVSGTLDVNGTCVACGSIATPFFHTLGMDSSGFVEAVVDWGSTPAVPVALFLVDTSDGETVGSYYSYTPGSGSWTFPGLSANTTYQLSASAFEPGEALCPPYATTNVTTPPSSVSLSLGASDKWGDYSSGELTINQDGTWSVSGAYIQLNSATGVQIYSTLNCSVIKGQTWPSWSVMIGANIAQAPTATLYGSGQSSVFTADWLTLVEETSANCSLYVSWPGGGSGGCSDDCDPCDPGDCTPCDECDEARLLATPRATALSSVAAPPRESGGARH
jgi:hypothetical protein